MADLVRIYRDCGLPVCPGRTFANCHSIISCLGYGWFYWQHTLVDLANNSRNTIRQDQGEINIVDSNLYYFLIILKTGTS